jgi:lipoate-protein ligase A
LRFNKSKPTTQDLGNTNFSIILPRLLFTRSGGAQLVAKAIRDRLSVPSCTVNDRNDVVIRDPEPELKAGRHFLSHFH